MTPEHGPGALGKVTASRVHDIIATIKSGGYSAGRKNYIAELVAERLTGTPAPSYQTAAMAYGIECEAEARVAYCLPAWRRGRGGGLRRAPDHQRRRLLARWAGAARMGWSRLNAPTPRTHIETLLGGKVPIEYITQMQCQMACTGRAWCRLGELRQRLPEHMRMVVRRVQRDDAIIERLNAEVDHVPDRA